MPTPETVIMAINVRVPLALALVAVLAVTCAYAVPAAQTSFNRAADEGGAEGAADGDVPTGTVTHVVIKSCPG